MKTQNKLVIKSENRKQDYLFPPNLDDFVDNNDLVRTVDAVLETINLDNILLNYKGGGASCFNPKTMLKIIVYAYTQKIYSSRQIAKALKTNVNFMWLASMQRPNYRTINYFRGKRMESTIEEVFTQFTHFLAEEGKVSLAIQYLDGTKIEANANKYSFVWKRSTKTHKHNLEIKIKNKLKEIQSIIDQENKEYGDKDLEEFDVGIDLSPENLQGISDRLNDSTNKELKKAKKQIDKDFLPRLIKYKKYLKILGNRNSFSKTDEDATFMRMKEDPMLNGQTKACYNLQIGTENQFITNYLLGQRPTDTKLLKPFIAKLEEHNRIKPEKLVADAGYGSSENYDYLEEANIDGYVKYNYFYKETRPRYKPSKYSFAGMEYDKTNNEFTCANGRKLKYEQDNIEYRSGTIRQIYRSEDCSGCDFAVDCKKGKINKSIWVNWGLEKHKRRIRDKLTKGEGRDLIKKRAVDVETVFGDIKQNMGIKRFMLRGLKKVNVEFGIIALAHNFRKLAIN